MPFKDLDSIRELRRREADLFDHARPSDDGRRIVIYSMDPWQIGVFEQFLHLAFELKGQRPVSIYYDGLLPITAWENSQVKAPRPGELALRAETIFKAFGIQPRGISRYLHETTGRRRADGVIAASRLAEFSALVYRNIPIGRIALRDLRQYTLGWFDPRESADFELYRAHLRHAVMSVDLANAILDAERPDIVVLVNGKSVMYSYMYEVARLRGLQVTTWEEGAFADNGIVLANDARAIDFPISDADWQLRRDVPLSAFQSAQVEQFFTAWRGQTATARKYYTEEMRDFDRMRSELSIPPDRRIISLFTNIIWDTNALDRDDAFDGILDWVCETIEFVRTRPEFLLIVRAHPGETRCEYKTRTPMRSMIAGRYGDAIPDGVRIVDGPSEFSSYEIAAHSERCAVYTSTLGMELSLLGLRPLICGVPFYSRRGITNDVTSKEQYRRLLSGEQQPADVDRDRLLRFAHLLLFEFVKRPEFFVGTHGHPQRPKIRIDTFRGFPHSMPVFNRIVDCILRQNSFVWPAPPPSTMNRAAAPEAHVAPSIAREFVLPRRSAKAESQTCL